MRRRRGTRAESIGIRGGRGCCAGLLPLLAVRSSSFRKDDEEKTHLLTSKPREEVVSTSMIGRKFLSLYINFIHWLIYFKTHYALKSLSHISLARDITLTCSVSGLACSLCCAVASERSPIGKVIFRPIRQSGLGHSCVSETKCCLRRRCVSGLCWFENNTEVMLGAFFQCVQNKADAYKCTMSSQCVQEYA